MAQGGAEVSASPQGKGVGLFALGGSPGDNGLKIEDQIKDPKVKKGVVSKGGECLYVGEADILKWVLFAELEESAVNYCHKVLVRCCRCFN